MPEMVQITRREYDELKGYRRDHPNLLRLVAAIVVEDGGELTVFNSTLVEVEGTVYTEEDILNNAVLVRAK